MKLTDIVLKSIENSVWVRGIGSAVECKRFCEVTGGIFWTGKFTSGTSSLSRASRLAMKPTQSLDEGSLLGVK